VISTSYNEYNESDIMTDIEALQGETLLVSGMTSGDSDPTAAVKRRKRDSDKAEGNDDESLKEKIVTIWQDVEDSTHLEKAIVATKEIVTEQVQGLIRMGLDAYQRAEHLATKVQLMTDELKQKDVEIGRLRSAEEKNTTSITVGVFAHPLSSIDKRGSQ
jgi:hypothetical protein